MNKWAMYFIGLTPLTVLEFGGGGGASASSVAAPVAATPVSTTPIKKSTAVASVSNPFSAKKVRNSFQYFGTTGTSDTSKLGTGI